LLGNADTGYSSSLNTMGVDVRTVLVVDDEQTVLAAAKRSMSASYEVATAPNTDEALALARDMRPDLAIIDLRISESSGLDLVRLLKEELPETIVVLCSGYLSLSTAVAAARAGVEHVLPKPISFKEILRRVTNDNVAPAGDPSKETPSLARVEYDHIIRVLEDCNGNISESARRLGIYRSSLQRRLRKYAPPK
jgi:two-component system, response regulator RegA